MIFWPSNQMFMLARLIHSQISQTLAENFWKLKRLNCQSGNGNWTRTPEMTRKVSVCRNINPITMLDSSDLEVHRISNFCCDIITKGQTTNEKWEGFSMNFDESWWILINYDESRKNLFLGVYSFIFFDILGGEPCRKCNLCLGKLHILYMWTEKWPMKRCIIIKWR